MRLLRHLLHVLPVLLLVTTCGQTGPLYLPDESQENTRSTSSVVLVRGQS